jgi:hypothetical protein
MSVAQAIYTTRLRPEQAAVVLQFTAAELTRAAELSTAGVWHVWRRNPDGPQPIFCGTVDTRAQAETGCLTPDYYLWLAPHNHLMSGETTDDPLPYLCYPRDPDYTERNQRDAGLFAELEAEKPGRGWPEVVARLEKLHARTRAAVRGG